MVSAYALVQLQGSCAWPCANQFAECCRRFKWRARPWFAGLMVLLVCERTLRLCLALPPLAAESINERPRRALAGLLAA